MQSTQLSTRCRHIPEHHTGGLDPHRLLPSLLRGYKRSEVPSLWGSTTTPAVIALPQRQIPSFLACLVPLQFLTGSSDPHPAVREPQILSPQSTYPAPPPSRSASSGTPCAAEGGKQVTAAPLLHQIPVPSQFLAQEDLFFPKSNTVGTRGCLPPSRGSLCHGGGGLLLRGLGVAVPPPSSSSAPPSASS